MDPNSVPSNSTHLLSSNDIPLPLTNFISQTNMSTGIDEEDIQLIPQLIDSLPPPSQASKEPLWPQHQHQQPTQQQLMQVTLVTGVYTLAEETELDMEENEENDVGQLLR